MFVTVKRWLAALSVVAVGLLTWFGAANAIRTNSESPAFADGVPIDLRKLARATWQRFTVAFPKQRECLEPVTVNGDWELDDRGSYDPHHRFVTVRIPGTAPNLEASLVHEFAHHLEFACPGQESLRSSFLVAQGLSGDAAWFEGVTWERTPSEQFAEAATEFVLGRRPSHVRIAVSAEAVRTISTWATRD